MPDVDMKEERLTQPLKFLPLAYVLLTIVTLWVIYTFFHCVPMLQIGVEARYVDHPVRLRGQIELTIFSYITVMLLICYARSILTHPGEIPSGDPKWEYSSTPDPNLKIVKEKKKTGDRRHCKWCGKYKPDRCHHCRVCQMCILKMDHHCPWIYNCVGFYNYKYFFLLILYSVVACQMIFWTMMDSVFDAITYGMPFFPMFILVFGETLSCFLSALLTTFWCFHVWLMFKAMTTIEFCEKSMPKKDEESCGWTSFDQSPYSVGAIGNVCSVLGDNPLTWLFPIWTVSGNGLAYDSESSRLLGTQTNPFATRPMEAHRSIKPNSRCRGNPEGTSPQQDREALVRQALHKFFDT